MKSRKRMQVNEAEEQYNEGTLREMIAAYQSRITELSEELLNESIAFETFESQSGMLETAIKACYNLIFSKLFSLKFAAGETMGSFLDRFQKAAKKFKIDLSASHISLSFTKEYILSILPESIKELIYGHVFETCLDLVNDLKSFNDHVFDSDAALYCPACASSCKASCSAWGCPAKKVASVKNAETQTKGVIVTVSGAQTFTAISVGAATQTKKPLPCYMATQTSKNLPCVIATQTEELEKGNVQVEVEPESSPVIEASVVKLEHSSDNSSKIDEAKILFKSIVSEASKQLLPMVDVKPAEPNVFGASLLNFKEITKSTFPFIQGGNGLSAIVKSNLSSSKKYTFPMVTTVAGSCLSSESDSSSECSSESSISCADEATSLIKAEFNEASLQTTPSTSIQTFLLCLQEIQTFEITCNEKRKITQSTAFIEQFFENPLATDMIKSAKELKCYECSSSMAATHSCEARENVSKEGCCPDCKLIKPPKQQHFCVVYRVLEKARFYRMRKAHSYLELAKSNHCTGCTALLEASHSCNEMMKRRRLDLCMDCGVAKTSKRHICEIVRIRDINRAAISRLDIASSPAKRNFNAIEQSSNATASSPGRPDNKKKSALNETYISYVKNVQNNELLPSEKQDIVDNSEIINYFFTNPVSDALVKSAETCKCYDCHSGIGSSHSCAVREAETQQGICPDCKIYMTPNHFCVVHRIREKARFYSNRKSRTYMYSAKRNVCHDCESDWKENHLCAARKSRVNGKRCLDCGLNGDSINHVCEVRNFRASAVGANSKRRKTR